MKYKSINWYQMFIHFILVCFSIIIILLVIKINKMQIKPEFIDQLKEGETFEPMEVQSLDQTKYKLAFSNKDKPTMLFIFTTSCPYCSQNIPNWKKIYEENKNDYDVIGIGADELDKVKDYAKENDLPYKVFVPLDKEFRKKYKISGVPQTIIIDTHKIVKKIHLGVVDTNKFMFEFSAL